MENTAYGRDAVKPALGKQKLLDIFQTSPVCFVLEFTTKRRETFDIGYEPS